mgnify:CR=1 FL=1
MQRCPYCGSEDGVFTTYTGKQFYFWNGEPAGYNADVPENQHKFARCISCERKVMLSRLAEDPFFPM